MPSAVPRSAAVRPVVGVGCRVVLVVFGRPHPLHRVGPVAVGHVVVCDAVVDIEPAQLHSSYG